MSSSSPSPLALVHPNPRRAHPHPHLMHNHHPHPRAQSHPHPRAARRLVGRQQQRPSVARTLMLTLLCPQHFLPSPCPRVRSPSPCAQPQHARSPSHSLRTHPTVQSPLNRVHTLQKHDTSLSERGVDIAQHERRRRVDAKAYVD